MHTVGMKGLMIYVQDLPSGHRRTQSHCIPQSNSGPKAQYTGHRYLPASAIKKLILKAEADIEDCMSSSGL